MEFASQCFTLQESVFPLLRCERGPDFLEAWIATQRVPVRVEFEKAVAERIRDALHFRDLLDGAIFLTSPSVNLSQINGEVDAVNSVFGHGQQFTGGASLSNCLFFPPEAGGDHAQSAARGRKVGLFFHDLFHFAARGGKDGSRFGRITLTTSN